ncbi:hypothetical protein U1763_02960 [Sphingomonas sp. LB2R24]|uniref:hypothetical protein n=1 Tax=Sphingomonas sorbitolis TaxID=3096165 RepID=UPI002FCB6D24
MRVKDDAIEITIEQAVRALIIRSELSTYASDMKENLRQYDWQHLVPILCRDLPSFRLTVDRYERLRSTASRMPTEFKSKLIVAFDAWLDLHWKEVRPTAIKRAKEGLSKNVLTDHDLRHCLARYPRLAADEDLIRTAIQKLVESRDPHHEYLNLTMLTGSAITADVLIEQALLHGWTRHSDQIAKVLKLWLGTGVRDKLMIALWSPSVDGVEDNDIAAVAKHLRQLPLRAGPPLSSNVLDGADDGTRTAWRRKLAELLETDEQLRIAATEALLWLAFKKDDRFVQFTAIEINGPTAPEVLRSLEMHNSALVVHRARSARDAYHGSPNLFDAFLTHTFPAEQVLEARSDAGRTWIDDPALENLLRQTFRNACDTFAQKVPATASSGEENLVGRLLERIETKCEDLNERAAALAHERSDARRLIVSIRHRVIGKKEEGSPGLLPTGRFSTDVAIVMRAIENDQPPFAERAIFIQAKRALRGDEYELDHLKLEIEQLRQLASQTESAFVLNIIPPTRHRTFPVLPARQLVERYGKVDTKTLDLNVLAIGGRDLADWLVDDVIGLWTGDPRDEAIAKAENGAGDRATVLVYLEVRKVPVDPDRRLGRGAR